MLRCSLGKHANNISFMLLFNDYIYIYSIYKICHMMRKIIVYFYIFLLKMEGAPFSDKPIWNSSAPSEALSGASGQELPEQSSNQRLWSIKHGTKMWFNHQTHQKPWDLTQPSEWLMYLLSLHQIAQIKVSCSEVPLEMGLSSFLPSARESR